MILIAKLVYEIYTIVKRHYNDERKADEWFKTRNHLLGNVSPDEMIQAGRVEKLLAFVQNAMDENR